MVVHANFVVIPLRLRWCAVEAAGHDIHLVSLGDVLTRTGSVELQLSQHDLERYKLALIIIITQ